jgi:hypothetical protein
MTDDRPEPITFTDAICPDDTLKVEMFGLRLVLTPYTTEPGDAIFLNEDDVDALIAFAQRYKATKKEREA